MRIKTSHILIVVMGVIIALMLYCSPNSPIEVEPTIERIVIRDTTYVQGTPDTIYFHDTTTRYVKIPIYVPVYDSIEKVNNYTTKYEDSLIKGRIFSKVDGSLIEQNLEYTPKFPKYIHRVDTLSIFVKDSITITQPEKKKISLYAGMQLGSNGNNLLLAPYISLGDRRNNLFSFGYDFVNKNYIVGYQRKLKFK